MKKLSVYLKRYTAQSILAPLFKLLEVVFDLLVPLVVARMINVGVAGQNRGGLVQCFLVLIAMALLGLACSITAQFFAAKASTAVQYQSHPAFADIHCQMHTGDGPTKRHQSVEGGYEVTARRSVGGNRG